MKRILTCQKINSNNTAVINDVYTNPLCVNMIDPEFANNENWQHHDVTVDIIELNDSDVSESSDETLKHKLNHAWSYTNNTIKSPQSQHNNYRVNRKAREKRRLNNDSFAFSPRIYTPNNFSDNIDLNTSDYKSNVRLNHQLNCFTLINKHFINSDTSSENTECDNIEQSTQIGDGLKENHEYSKVTGEEILTYKSDCDEEKKTIWIYSFKNKRLLSDDCIEMVNIPSNETDSSTSFSFEKFEDTDNISRVASPIPPPYIPRLNLSLGQTLSTVTEVTEPNKQPSSVETERLTKVPLVKRSKNSWFLNNYKNNGDCINAQEKSTNVVNWMALSPRERRRFFRENNSISDVVFQDKLSTLQEVIYNTETEILNGPAKIDNEIYSKTVDVDIHVSIPESYNTFEKQPNNDPITNQSDSQKIEVVPDENIVEVLPDDKNIQVFKFLRKPQINISGKCLRNTRNVTDPLEKLNTDNWIVEETDYQPVAYSYDLERQIVNSNDIDYKLTANDRLWSKNAVALMKSAQWNEYAPIAESHLSLHLSLDTTVGKQTWLSRLINLFKCCN